MVRTSTVALFMSLLWGSVVAARDQAPAAIDLADLADLYCVAADGDHDITWNRAEADGFSALTPEQFKNLRLPGARDLRGYSRTVDGVEVRVLTARNTMSGMGGGATPFHLCWVSARPLDRREVERSFQHSLGQRGFRQERARMFLWVPQPDGSNKPISRREWSRYGQSIQREMDARTLLINDYRGMTAVTYMRALESCQDWCYAPGSSRRALPAATAINPQ